MKVVIWGFLFGFAVKLGIDIVKKVRYTKNNN